MSLATVSAGLKIAGGLKSLFGKKPSAREQSRDALMGQAQGAREAADKYGFNPLTLLGVSSGIGVNSAADTPLASVEMITGAMQDIADVYTSRDAHAQARERFNREFTGIEMDRARAGHTTVLTRPRLANSAMAGGGAFGGDHVTRHDIQVPPEEGPLSLGEIPVPDPNVDRGHGLFGSGFYLEAPPGWTPGGVAEEELGEIASIPYQAAYAGAYLGHNLGRLTNYVRSAGDIDSALREQEAYRRRNMPEYWTHPQTGFSAKRYKY